MITLLIIGAIAILVFFLSITSTSAKPDKEDSISEPEIPPQVSSLKKQYDDLKQEIERTQDEEKHRKERVAYYYNLHKGKSLAELREIMRQGKKASYGEYTEDSKRQFHALKLLEEEYTSAAFRDFILEKQYKESTLSSIELRRQYLDRFDHVLRKQLESIPEGSVQDFETYIQELSITETVNKLKDYSITQIRRWIEKNGEIAKTTLISEYLGYRFAQEELEHAYTKEINRLRSNINQNTKAGNADKVAEYEALYQEAIAAMTKLKNKE